MPGPVLDLSAQGVQKLDPSFVCSEDTHTLILDRNHIMKLDHLERSPGLQQVFDTGGVFFVQLLLHLGTEIILIIILFI